MDLWHAPHTHTGADGHPGRDDGRGATHRPRPRQVRLRSFSLTASQGLVVHHCGPRRPYPTGSHPTPLVTAPNGPPQVQGAAVGAAEGGLGELAQPLSVRPLPQGPFVGVSVTGAPAACSHTAPSLLPLLLCFALLIAPTQSNHVQTQNIRGPGVDFTKFGETWFDILIVRETSAYVFALEAPTMINHARTPLSVSISTLIRARPLSFPLPNEKTACWASTTCRRSWTTCGRDTTSCCWPITR